MGAKSRKEQILAMLQQDPTDTFLQYALAMEHVSVEDWPEAVAAFRRLLQQAPDYVPAYLQLGQTLRRAGNDGEARIAWQQGIAAALRTGDQHAAGEMQGFLEEMGG